MTKSKLLKLLYMLDPNTVIVNMYDYKKMELEKYKSMVENRSALYVSDKSFFIHYKYSIKDLIRDLESADGVNSKVFKEDDITYMSGWYNVTFRDIYDNFKELSKNPAYFPIFVKKSSEKCDEYYIQNKRKIERYKTGIKTFLASTLKEFSNIGWNRVHM